MTKIKQFIKKYEKMPVVARASLWFVICGFMTRGVSLLTTPIFTRLLTTEQYGVYSVFNSWLEIVTIFASLKLGYGVYIQGLVKFNDDQDRFSSSLLGLATTWCGGVFLIYLLFHKTFNSTAPIAGGPTSETHELAEYMPNPTGRIRVIGRGSWDQYGYRWVSEIRVTV